MLLNRRFISEAFQGVKRNKQHNPESQRHKNF